MDAEISERSGLVEDFKRNGFFVAKAPLRDDLLACGDIFGAKVFKEYPDFFRRLPQNPMYELGSDSGHIFEALAGLLWRTYINAVLEVMAVTPDTPRERIEKIRENLSGCVVTRFDVRHVNAWLIEVEKIKAKLEEAKNEVE